MKVLGIATAAVALMAIPAAAQESRSETTTDEAASADARAEKRICKTEKITGSLTRVRRTCFTQSEWDRMAEIARRDAAVLDRDGHDTARETLQKPMVASGG